MDKSDHPQAYGVFKPVGHVVISFPPEVDLDAAQRALSGIGVPPSDVEAYSAEQMRAQATADLADAGVLASLGQELNLVKAHLALAEKGYRWLVVRADDDERARAIADAMKPLGAERAQSYGRLLIEELIERPTDAAPVFESPARGLDAQTPSGKEADR